ncbi:outer membrane beta-barrel protein [Campylobacter sp. MIT 99-7217]|uniref:outer membrane beta-barrel protein n=1 Tax=Campylobacter sp. MIT 99-7217 TaxID=535091 RepID=UPI00163CDE25|nr:outer membrane beta-barrel protein [Campylobacter sp. MIT 99-7217]
MKKIASSVILASSLLSCTAFAEEAGFFIGANTAYGSIKAGDTSGFNAYRFGLVGGYKQFFTEEFGARYYLNLDTGTKYTKGSNNSQIQRFDLGLNVDALYNFLQSNDLEYGVFGGLSLDYAMNEEKLKRIDGPDGQGLDLGINFGLRLNYAQKHGVELFSRFGLTGVKLGKPDDSTQISPYSDEKIQTPYAVGLRYTYSF